MINVRAKFRGDPSSYWRFILIFKYDGRPPSWICCAGVWTTHEDHLVLYHSAKFGWNRSSNFDNMQVLMFGEFGLKMSVHASFGAVFWTLTQ